MASNSKREQIIVALEEQLLTIPSIKHVKRTRPEFAELKKVASTQMPLVAIVAGLPQPKQKKSGRVAGATSADVFLSDLPVDMFCYANGGATPDQLISSLADDVWGSVMTIGNAGKLIHDVTIRPQAAVGYWDPYIVFKLSATIVYHHLATGI